MGALYRQDSPLAQGQVKKRRTSELKERKLPGAAHEHPTCRRTLVIGALEPNHLVTIKPPRPLSARGNASGGTWRRTPQTHDSG